MMRRALAVLGAVGCLVGGAEDARAQQRLEPPVRTVRRLPVSPCEPSSVLGVARAARDRVDPRAADASRLRAEAYRDAFLQRVGTCLDERLTWTASVKTGPAAWAKAQGTISGYFIELWRGGALVGTRAEEASFARCDRTTMTQTQIDAGLLVCTYGLALFRPAEFELGVVRARTSGPEPVPTR